MMQLALFRHLIDEAADIDGISLYLHVGGESLLHPRLNEMLEYAMGKRNRFSAVGFFTNGMLFNEKVAETVVRSGLDWVTFSLDGVGEVTERIRRGSNYATLKRNIQQLIQLRGAKLKPRVGINTTITTQSDSELRDIWKEWTEKVDQVSFYPQLNDDFSISNLARAQRFDLGWRIEQPCAMPLTMLCIFWNGDVTYCCHNLKGKYLLSNVRKADLMKIWRSKEMQEIRKGILSGTPFPETLCEKCGKYNWKPLKTTNNIPMESSVHDVNRLRENDISECCTPEPRTFP